MDNLGNIDNITPKEAIEIMYKSALQCKKEKNIWPITFSLKYEKIEKLEKKNLVSSAIPGTSSCHMWIFDHPGYYKQYNESYFAHTWMKANWDCNRHVEIIKHNCLPYMHDIKNCPKYTMFFYPKKKMCEIIDFDFLSKPKFRPVTKDEPWWNRWVLEENIKCEQMNVKKYEEYQNYFSKFFSLFLTTEQQFKYIIRCLGIDFPKKVLILNKDKCSDYLADSYIKYILENELGFDYPMKESMYNDNPKHENIYLASVDVKYKTFYNRENIFERIKNKEFDLIIVGDYSRIVNEKIDDLLDIAKKIYPKNRFIGLNGSDAPTFKNFEDFNIFTREIIDHY